MQLLIVDEPFGAMAAGRVAHSICIVYVLHTSWASYLVFVVSVKFNGNIRSEKIDLNCISAFLFLHILYWILLHITRMANLVGDPCGVHKVFFFRPVALCKSNLSQMRAVPALSNMQIMQITYGAIPTT